MFNCLIADAWIAIERVGPAVDHQVAARQRLGSAISHRAKLGPAAQQREVARPELLRVRGGDQFEEGGLLSFAQAGRRLNLRSPTP